jgi:very-short-patch-repair endonuclease
MSRIHYKEFKGITLLARDLRNNQTPSEKLLWEVLRRKGLFAYKFLRQHPIYYRIDNNWVDFYIADFYCARLMLIIELDGKSHEGREDYDSDRDEKLLSKGLKVVRIKNEELLDINNVIGIIKEIIKNQVYQLSNNKQNATPALNFKGRGRGKGLKTKRNE